MRAFDQFLFGWLNFLESVFQSGECMCCEGAQLAKKENIYAPGPPVMHLLYDCLK
jgi:hypothetical protein